MLVLLSGEPIVKKPLPPLKKPQEIAMQRLSAGEVFFLLRSFFSGDLDKWDREDKLPESTSIKIRYFFARTTGKSLIEQTTHGQINAIIMDMDKEPTYIGGCHWPEYQRYILAYAVGMADPMSELNRNRPAPIPVLIEESLKEFTRLLHDRVLND